MLHTIRSLQALEMIILTQLDRALMQVADGAFKYFHFFENKHVHPRCMEYTDIRMKHEFSQSQIELQAYIEAENAKVAAWVAEDPANRFAGMITSNPDHWADYGIFTVDQYLFSTAMSNYSDSYKGVYGMRPDLSRFKTLAEIEEAQKFVYADMKAQLTEEQCAYDAWVESKAQRAYDEELSDEARLLNMQEERGLAIEAALAR